MPPAIQVIVNGLRIPLPGLPQRDPGIFILRPEDPVQDRQQQTMERDGHGRRVARDGPQLVCLCEHIAQAQLNGRASLIQTGDPGFIHQVE